MRQETTITRAVALLLCTLLGAPGCATTRASGVVMMPTPEARLAERTALVEYMGRLPPGSAVRLDLSGGRTLRGTLLKATDRSAIVQPKTRIPEPPVEVSMSDVVRVTLETRNGANLAKAVGIGVAVGVGAFFGILLLAFAIAGGD